MVPIMNSSQNVLVMGLTKSEEMSRFAVISKKYFKKNFKMKKRIDKCVYRDTRRGKFWAWTQEMVESCTYNYIDLQFYFFETHRSENVMKLNRRCLYAAAAAATRADVEYFFSVVCCCCCCFVFVSKNSNFEFLQCFWVIFYPLFNSNKCQNKVHLNRNVLRLIPRVQQSMTYWNFPHSHNQNYFFLNFQLFIRQSTYSLP